MLTPILLLALLLALTYALLLWRTRRRTQKRWIILDGSNVMHWQNGTPDLAPLKQVISTLTAQGFTPGVVFDANAGYLLRGKYAHDHALGKMLGLPSDRILVVPKGTQADRYILMSARDLNARIVTNDRYRDWAETFPEVATKGHLIQGGYRNGTLWLDPL